MIGRHLLIRRLALIALCLGFVALCGAQPKETAVAVPIVANGLGKGTTPLDNPWAFHTGDDLMHLSRTPKK